MSKNQKIKIRKSDRFRAILTDVLPYEVPILFSNEGLYCYLVNDNSCDFKKDFDINIFDKNKWTIPYVYKIRKNASEYRTLSVMHPQAQVEAANIYSKYDHVIISLCQRSDWSLRAPSAISSYYVEKTRSEKIQPTKSGEIEEKRSGFETIPKIASSYFVYSKYGLLYKFIESKDFHKYEKQFRFLRKLDISQCFTSIYTHSIAWAVKSKKFAKENLRKDANSIEGELDSFMQLCNYGETAGIIIGPEISRIFAEIILQRVDVTVESFLSETLNLYNKKHYIIQRYVDDYFVFANDEGILDTIQRVLSSTLLDFKLNLNLAKTLTATRPFLTGETSARLNLAKLITEFFSKHISEKGNEKSTEGIPGEVRKKIFKPKLIRRHDNVTNTFIRDIKIILKANQTTYDASANYFFSVAKRQIIDYTKKLPFSELDYKSAEHVIDFIYIFLDILFFFYAMTIRVRQTYVLSEIIILLIQYLKNAPTVFLDRIYTKIVEEISEIMKWTSANSEIDNVEMLNLLIPLRSLGRNYLIESDLLMKLLQIVKNEGKLKIDGRNFGYFQIVTGLYYMNNVPEYKELRIFIINYVLNRFKDDPDWENKAEMVFILLDFIRCPDIHYDNKIELAKICLRRKSGRNLNFRTEKLVQFIQTQDWFFKWGDDINLADILQRKDLRTPY